MLFILRITFLTLGSLANLNPGGGTILMPLNCSELLPDTSPFIQYFESVARGAAASDRPFSLRVFKLLALRERLAEEDAASRDQNPVDIIIRKSLCFYREQKEPVRPIPYDDETFVLYLKKYLKEIEIRVEKIIIQTEFEKRSRKAYEEKLTRNKATIDVLRREAEREANSVYKSLSNQAQRKLREK